MKPTTRPQPALTWIAAILTSLWVPATADATAYTNPVGYETLKVHGSAYSLLALRLHQPADVEGVLETISTTTLTDGDVDFTTDLSAPKPYFVELFGGSVDGKVIDIISHTAHTLTVAESLPNETNITYRIRSIPRLSEVINPIETLAVDDFNPDHGDLILLPAGDGHFNQYYCSSHIGHPGYFNAVTGLPEDPLLYYTESFFYLRRDVSPFDLVVMGEIKTENTLLSVTDTFNYVGSAYPIITLGDTGLEASMQSGTAETADIVWMQEATGEYQRYFYSNGAPPLGTGWRQVNAPPGAANDDQGAVPITSGLIIQRRAPLPYKALLTPPDFYQDL